MKKISSYLTILYLLCFIFPGHAQNNEKRKNHHNFKLGIESGTDFMFGSTIKPDMVRESKSSYYGFDDNDFYCGILWDYETLNITYLGIKPEISFAKNRISVATGIRLSRYSTNTDSDKDYFLWKIYQDEINTEYIKIREITQNSYYLGIPLEAKFYPNKRELAAQIYFKTGVVFNYRIHTNNKIKFQNTSSEANDETINDQVNQNLKDFNSYMFVGCGLKIGRHHTNHKKHIPHINIEAHVLNIMFTDKATSFIRTNAGLGVQLSVQIPLGKTVPIGSRN
jgi:hypothetical protein